MIWCSLEHCDNTWTTSHSVSSMTFVNSSAIDCLRSVHTFSGEATVLQRVVLDMAVVDFRFQWAGSVVALLRWLCTFWFVLLIQYCFSRQFQNTAMYVLQVSIERMLFCCAQSSFGYQTAETHLCTGSYWSMSLHFLQPRVLSNSPSMDKSIGLKTNTWQQCLVQSSIFEDIKRQKVQLRLQCICPISLCMVFAT